MARVLCGCAVRAALQASQASGRALDIRQENEAHEIAQRISRRQDLGCHTALGPADGLAQSPPLLRPGRADEP